jgi:hypothetical protein
MQSSAAAFALFDASSRAGEKATAWALMVER